MPIRRRIKKGLKKAVKKVKKSKIKNIVSRGLKKKVTIKPDLPKENILGREETRVERLKFFHPKTTQPVYAMHQDLPSQYTRDRIVIQVRDPWWIHAYWQIRQETLRKLEAQLKEEFYKAKRILRIYDVSDIIFDGANAHRFFDILINVQTNNWYINTAIPGRSWCVDFGLLLSDGRFIVILRSNSVETPEASPSNITDEEWMVPEEMFARLYGMGFGLGRSSPVGKAWHERIKGKLFSDILASPGITSVTSPVKIQNQRKS